jgi:hypothetical protein
VHTASSRYLPPGAGCSSAWPKLCRAYDVLGFDRATGGNEVFGHLVLLIIEPASKQDSLRMLFLRWLRRSLVAVRGLLRLLSPCCRQVMLSRVVVS